jgi:uncharacterized protein YndB with AHSA1/START domain
MATKELIITRNFNAPRALVWKAWTDPEHFMRWWGPKDFTSPVCKIDLRVNGKYLYSMQGPDGQIFWSTGVFLEIIEPEKLVFTDNFADENGNVVSASEHGLGDYPAVEFIITILLEEENNTTKLTLKHEGLPEGEMTEMTAAGWNESFDKLAFVLNNQ